MGESRFNDDGSLNDRQHKQDHHELGELLDKRKENQDMWSKIKTSFITSLLFTMFSGLMTVIWFAINSFVKGDK